MKQRLGSIAIATALAACACPAKPTTAPAGSGALTNGSATPPPVAPPAVTTCDGLKPKLDQLYRADAQLAEPQRVDQRTADNVGMVLADCAKDPAAVVACVTAAATIKDIESKCLAPIDDEGTEGDRLKSSGK